MHLNAVCKKTCAGIGVLKRTKPFVHNEYLHTIYKALIQSYFDHCSPVYGNWGVLLKEKLQRFQNKAARIVKEAKLNASSSELLELQNRKNIENRFRSNKLTRNRI